MKSYFKDRKDYSITRLSMFLLSSPYALIYKRFSDVYIYHSVFPYYDVYDFSFITGKKKGSADRTIEFCRCHRLLKFIQVS